MSRSISTSPAIVIEEQELSYSSIKRLKVLWLKGTLVRKTAKVKRKTSVPSYTMCHAGKTTQDLRIPDTDGGHIMALNLGGVDIKENIVPMYSGFNRHGEWRKAEDEIAKYLDENKGTFQLYVEIEYQQAKDGGDPRIPSSFTYRIEDDKDKVVVKAKTLQMVKDTPVNTMIDLATTQLISEAQKQVDAGWTLEKGLDKGSTIPGAPGSGVTRPYAALDYLDLNKKITMTEFGNGRSFTWQQRENILTVNRARNGGWLVSDDTVNENGKRLSLYGDAGAEIDHIVPKSQGGSNCYSNARVISSALNKTKGNKTS